ncbi:hypothetical protein OF117_13410 [Geodermatophilus sp. YIM 151500]|uniref:hypothetical protein n=1 Tax=Geodermatophilus sp. YIM 151500 TaxID=2984531 RepID=UPI0021E3C67C|nr:hypothetical protein [Geodermatophilus sp. YIM 151500]MCV2490360.1 hypothetical protein [Geodermatophilus sp. YIM 151500]
MRSATLEDAPEDSPPGTAHHLPAAAAAVAAVALLVAAPEVLGDGGRFAAVLVLQLALVAGWVVTARVRGATGAVVVGAGAAVAADLALVLPERPALGGLLGVLGVGFLAVVLQQMLRTRRDALVASLAGGVLLLCAVSALAVVLRRAGTDDGERLAVTALLAVGGALLAGHLADLVLPRPQIAFGVPRGLFAAFVAVGAGAGVAWLRRAPDDLLDALAASTYGGVLGAVAVLTSLVASYVVIEAGVDGGRPRWAAAAVQGVLPLAAAAPVALAMALQITP